MKRNLSGLTVVLAMLLVVGMVAPVLAQGLDEVYEWPELGFAISHPTGWISGAPDSETRILVQDPNYDIDSNEPPNSPAIAIIGLPADFAEMMGSPEAVLDSFASEFGGDSEVTTLTVAGYDALRVAGAPEEGFLADIVLIIGDSNLYIVLGITPEGQDFTALFESMLESIVITAPVETQPQPVMPSADGPMVNAVRITVDQTLTGSWNEIDAVELVGTDASGAAVNQWAISAEASSQYGDDSWSAAQATGEPNTLECGDITTAWASETSSGIDSLTLTYGSSVVASAVNIHQTYNPGAIVMVELLPAAGQDPIVVFEGVDTTTECPGVFSVAVDSSMPGGEAIAVGATVNGALDNTAYFQDWTFDGAAGDVVTITLVNTSGDLDPFLYLLDADGATLTTNDDADDASVGAFNSQIVSFTLPADGSYIIRATRFGDEFGGTTGSYALTLDSGGSTAPGPEASTTGTIAYGETASGSISDSATSQVWTFTGTADDIVTITMAADGMVSLDAYLVLQDNSGAELASNDDAGVDSLAVFDSQILGYALPYTGEYTIVAGRISGTGDYLLTVDSGAASAALTMNYGDTVTGTISDETIRELWAFEGTQGDIITITMIDPAASPTLDSYVALLGPDGTEVTNNDDAADTSIGAFNSQIAMFSLPETGTYTIVASRFGEEFGSGSGSYELNLRLDK